MMTNSAKTPRGIARHHQLIRRRAIIAEVENNDLREVLQQILQLATGASTGPSNPDALWKIRGIILSAL